MSLIFRKAILGAATAASLIFSAMGIAGGVSTEPVSNDIHYFAMAAMGYGDMSGANIDSTDGQTVFANVDIGWRFYQFKYGTLDLLGDVMNGNRFNTVQLVQGLSTPINIQPSLALLMGANFNIPRLHNWIFTTQVGARLMRATFDVTGINNKTTVRPDLRFAIKKQLMRQLALVMMYQHTFGNNPVITVNSTTFIGTLSDVPSINAGTIGLEFDF